MDSSTSTPTFPHRSSNTSTSTTAGTTSTGTSNNSNCRIRPRQEYGSTMDDNPSEATTATPAATNCNRVRCISEDSNSIISNSIISNSNNNYSLGTRNNRLRSASASSVVSVASLASSKCAANNQNQTHQQQHQQQKRRAAAAASPIPKSSKSEVMILLKRLFIRCFMTRRKRRRRVLATRKIKKNSFQSADDNDNDNDKANSNSNSNNTGNNTSRGIHLEAQEAQQLRSSSKPYSAIPCNETEMYLMLRSKRTNTTLGGADRNHHRSHSNSHSLPMVGTKSYDSNNTYNSSMGHYRASQSTPLGDRHLRRRTSSAESNKPRRQTTARPSSIAVTRKRSSTIGTTTPSHIFIERQEPRHIVNENEKENDIHIDVDVDIEPLSSFS